MNNETIDDHHYVSHVPYYDLDNGDDDSIIEPSLNIVSTSSTTPYPEIVDPTLQYLYALDLQLQLNKSNWDDFYKSPLHNDSDQLLAHMDAGSMASTTDQLNFLLDCQSLQDTAPTLRVANNTPHYPTGVGYLKIPTIDPPGYASVRTFYTPSLPATILSPTSTASDLKCLGYSSFANLDGQNCCLTLHGSEDTKITFPLQLQHGLLFTQTLQ